MSLILRTFTPLRVSKRGAATKGRHTLVTGFAAALGLTVLPGFALAQAVPPYEITRYTIDSGGGRSVSGIYELNGTIGQPDASQVVESGGFQLTGGFWRRTPSGTQNPLIFRDGFEDVAP